jgi:hypothetical protein
MANPEIDIFNSPFFSANTKVMLFDLAVLSYNFSRSVKNERKRERTKSISYVLYTNQRAGRAFNLNSHLNYIYIYIANTPTKSQQLQIKANTKSN